MASSSPAPSPPPSPENLLRTSSRTMSRTSSRRVFSQSLSVIAVSDAVDATEIRIETRSAGSSPQLGRREAPSTAKGETFTLPLPSSPRVGPHNFEKIRILGAGSTGRVYLVRSVGLGEEAYFAMKVVKKSELVRRNRVQRVLTERQILSVANHPFVVTLHYSFQTAEYFYLVMQYCAGGELFSFLRSQENHRVSEDQARFYAAEVLIALEYLHMLGIIYRDLKPENILVHESGHVMLSDFDLAYEVKPASSSASLTASEAHRTESLKYPKPLLAPLSPNISTTDANLWFKMRYQHQMNRTTVTPSEANDGAPSPGGGPTRRRRFSCPCVCMPRAPYPHLDTESHMELGVKRTSFVGTHEYVAPEIISEEGYVGSVDWWAFGVLLYEMLFGVTPFRGKTQIQTLENILDICGEIEFPDEIPISEDCKDLILKLLDRNVAKRMQNPLVIKSHPFFKDLIWPLIRHQQPPIIPAMVHSLQEKVFSQEQMNEFDDEVPFHRALSSPQHRQRFSHASVSSTGSTVHLASIAQLSTDEDSFGDESVDESKAADDQTPRLLQQSPGSHKSIVASDGTPINRSFREGMSTPPSPVRYKSPSRNASITASSSSRAVSLTGFTPASPSSMEPPPSPNMTGGVVHDFEFISNQRRSFWSSRESHRSLSAKMSQLDMATYTPHELRPERYGEEDDDDDDDEEDDEGGEAKTVDLRGSITGALGFQLQLPLE